ncbi:hypothetical protein REPUB_Repub03eG0280000 [Reevesia pubescens]
MGKMELMKHSFLLLITVLLLLSIMFQCKVVATSRRFSWSSDLSTRKLLENMQDYPGNVPSIPDDSDYNDFYRRQGDVPSPGSGH